MGKAEQLITEHLDLWTGAIKHKASGGRGKGKKVELYGVKKLRELILDMAVRGLLVPQDAEDEPASVLLERIAAEKENAVQSGKVKKQKALPSLTPTEHTFETPKSWKVIRIRDAINVLNGRAYKKHEMLQEGTPILRVGNLFTSNEWYYSDLELEPEKYIDNGDLIYAWSASFGPFIWNGGRTIYHYHIWKMDLFDHKSLDKQYCRLYLQAMSDSNKASGKGIAMIHMTKAKMESLALPIPPLPEQHRIVAKVDELMALCDQLEQQTEASLSAHQTLVHTLLDALTEAAKHTPGFEALTRNNPSPFTQAWHRLHDHFDSLFTTEHSIDQLKQTLLQLAVMGKLVPQDPSDEPASELLKRIADEKSALVKVKAKKIKKQKVLEFANQEIKNCPAGWCPCYFGEIHNLVSGQHLKPSEYFEQSLPGSIPYLTGPAEFGVLSPIATRYTTEKRAIAEKYDILITCKGSGVGKLNVSDCETAISRQLMAIQPILISNDFCFLLAQSLNSHFRSNIVGIAIPGISREDVTQAPIELPPIEEQHRIVAKIDQLTTLCDQLKSRLADNQTTQLQLADAITAQKNN